MAQTAVAITVAGKEYFPQSPAIDWETAESRISELKEFLLDAPQRMAAERIEYLLEVYDKYQNEPPIIIRAKLFEKLMMSRPIFFDGNPIAGTMTGVRAGVYAYPEWNANWIKDEIDLAMMSHLGEVQVTPEIRKLMDKVWPGRVAPI
jgi:hypothetical protein